MTDNSLLAGLQFRGKKIWVTGAAKGIGYQVADSFARLGAEVIGFDREFPSDAYPFATQLLDIADPQQVSNICRQLLIAQQRLDVLVSAAGIMCQGKLDELTIDAWQNCFAVNISGVFYLLREILPQFKAQRSGCIVNIASNAAHVPRINMGAYCASKAALVSLSHCAALELAEYGVRCNLVSPGSTDTPMLRTMLGGEAGYQRTIAGLPEQYKLGIPLKKIARPQEIANTVIFLASDLASHITMQDIVVDGGATLAA